MLTGWAQQMASLWQNKEAIRDDFLEKWNAADQWERGLFHGQILGWLMMTILLVIMTLGESAPAAVAGLSSKFPRLIQLLKVVDAIGDVTTYARAVGKGVTLPTKAVEAVKNRVGKANRAADDATEKASEARTHLPEGADEATDGPERQAQQDGQELEVHGPSSNARSAVNSLRLAKQLASEAGAAELLAGGGKTMAGAGTRIPIRDVPRLVAEHGGKSDDWAKVASATFKFDDFTTIEVHGYRNVVTGETVELKSKIGTWGAR
jgi:hypothetical protein